ncbi:hypothetical protein JB92DRAFT_2833234 [Gautieria morchelliformis]|nr:hypothetical protein JB92DRAFT_2833234 [Gautieria morchelliformis]
MTKHCTWDGIAWLILWVRTICTRPSALRLPRTCLERLGWEGRDAPTRSRTPCEINEGAEELKSEREVVGKREPRYENGGNKRGDSAGAMGVKRTGQLRTEGGEGYSYAAARALSGKRGAV